MNRSILWEHTAASLYLILLKVNPYPHVDTSIQSDTLSIILTINLRSY